MPLTGRDGRARRFRAWRRTRPFWAGLLVLLAGCLVAMPPLAAAEVMLQAGAAVSGTAVGTILVAGGLFLWFAPEQRRFVAVVTAVCSVFSFAGTNFGGLGIGMLLGIVGSGMAFGWQEPTAEQGSGRQLMSVALVAFAPMGSLTAAPAPPPPAPAPSSIVASRLDASDLRVRGSRVLRTADGNRQVLVLHARRATLHDLGLATAGPGPRLRLGFTVTLEDVDLYLESLRGDVQLAGASVPVSLTARQVPASIPLDVLVPRFVARDVQVRQALVSAASGRFPALSLGAGA